MGSGKSIKMLDNKHDSTRHCHPGWSGSDMRKLEQQLASEVPRVATAPLGMTKR
jgi:hypothetical protein